VFGDIELLKRTAPELDRWRITYLNEIPTSALVRRSALEEVGGWQLRLGYEDWDLDVALAGAGWEGVYVPGAISRYYRQHGPRMLQEALRIHARLVDEIRRRSPTLFERRAANWRASRAPWRLKLLVPVLARLPFLGPYGRQRLIHLTADPRRVLRVALRRRVLARRMRRH